MKIPTLRKKIIVNFTAFGLLATIFGGGIFYNIYVRSTVDEKVDKIKAETSQLKNQATELQSKSIEVKKYTELWQKLGEKKKNINGIKMDEVNADLAALADKYTITTPVIKVALPETMKDGLFKRTTVNILITNVSLSFYAVNDVKALAFISEFLDSLPGYAIVTNLDLRKGKKYTDKDLIDISTGKGPGAITGKLDFVWYVYKKKDEPKIEEKKSDKPKPNIEPAKEVPPSATTTP